MAERRWRLLVVDDDDDLRVSLAEALEDAGFAVVQAENGQRALTLLEKERPDVILLDLLMPVLNGWQFCQAKDQNPATASIPVIAMSAAVSKDPGSPYFIDVEDFIAKPVELDELLEKIAGLTSGSAKTHHGALESDRHDASDVTLTPQTRR